MRNFFISLYHYLWALGSALYYGFPSRKLIVIGVTGTKGKTTVTDLVAAILREDGKKVVVSSTLHFTVGDDEQRNLLKMTMPGRSFLQSLLARGVHEGCTHAVIEMSSEGARQYRHRFIALDALVVTNISPEHIESHGSYENYLAAKRSIALALAHSSKKHRVLVVNDDDSEKETFLSLPIPTKVTFSDNDPFPYDTILPGAMNRMNIRAAARVTHTLGVSEETIKSAIKKFRGVRGRMEAIENRRGIRIYVDYAHTKDSLAAAYQAAGAGEKVCVLGSCGGGRDKWKRKEMAEVAHEYCRDIILTNEDPYDEDPQAIITEMAEALPSGSYTIVLDRRAAIRAAILKAKERDTLMITGKGTDPFIMGPHGTKEPWDDATVVREELEKLNTDG